MKYKMNLFLMFLFSVQTAFANEAEGGHHHEPSILDLKYPALNFIIFAGFIIYKARKPLSDMFTKKAEEVKFLMDSAKKHADEAGVKLDLLQKKIKGIDSDVVKINSEYDADVVNFANQQKAETETTMARMKRDLESKIEGEKKELNDELSHELLNLVINKTQTTISSDSNLKTKATTNIISGIR